MEAHLIVKSDSPADHLNDQLVRDFKRKVMTDLSGSIHGVNTTVTLTYSVDEEEVEPEPTVEIGGVEMTEAQFDAARFPLVESLGDAGDEIKRLRAQLKARDKAEKAKAAEQKAADSPKAVADETNDSPEAVESSGDTL